MLLQYHCRYLTLLYMVSGNSIDLEEKSFENGYNISFFKIRKCSITLICLFVTIFNYNVHLSDCAGSKFCLLT